MNRITGLIAATASLFCGISIATAADDGGWMTCKDGLKTHSAVVCDLHGGILIEPVKQIPIKSTPIDTNKPLTPNKAAKAKPIPSNRIAQQKTAAKRTRDPTARCLDGALYYSTERRGACASHGGVDKWFGW